MQTLGTPGTPGNTKPWYTSLGVWGGVGAILASLLGLAGYHSEDASVTEFATHAAAIGGGVAGLIALIGRIRATKVIKLVALPLVLGLLLISGGCGVSTLAMDSEQIRTAAKPSSTAIMDADGKILANYEGVAPSQVMQDAEGTYLTTPGIGSVVTFDPVSKKFYIWSPGDVVMKNVKARPDPAAGEAAFEAELIESNKSSVASVYAQQFTFAMDAIKDMTRAEAEARVKQLEQARLITSDVAGLLLQTVIPHLP